MHVLLGADVLLLLRLTRHFADANSILDVSELQAQVLASDGQHGSALPGSRLRIQLKWEEKHRRIEVGIGVSQNVIIDLSAKAATVHHIEYIVSREGRVIQVIMVNRPPIWKNHTLATSLPAMKNDLRSINSSSNSVKHPQPAERRHLTRCRP